MKAVGWVLEALVEPVFEIFTVGLAENDSEFDALSDDQKSEDGYPW